MATHSNILAWRIPGTEEPGGLPSMGSQAGLGAVQDGGRAVAVLWGLSPSGRALTLHMPLSLESA